MRDQPSSEPTHLLGEEELERLLERLKPSALGLLALLSEGPMTGYEIKKAIDSPDLIFWRDSFGSIYPNLHRLVEIGLAVKERNDLKGRKRIYYSLTPRGRELTAVWLRKPANREPARVELLLKLRYAYPQGPEVLRGLLESYAKHYRSVIGEYERYLQTFDLLEGDLRTETRRMAADYWTRLTRMLLEWSDASLERLKEFYDDD